ncbi:MAG TPA: xanthine dehydrogenase molybdopterin binding subunit, partial [Tepidisphaeraceae bacterium]
MPYVGQDIPHDSATGHVSGKSMFIDDFPPMHGELLVGHVGSPVAHGRIRSVDISLTKNMPGVAAVLLAFDVPHNRFGPAVHDEDVLASEKTQYVGQPIVLIAADTLANLNAAKKTVVLDVEPLEAVLTIDAAIERDQFLCPPRKIERGDIDKAFREAPRTLSGELHIGGQEHFYLESQACLVVPGEANTFTVHSSTQHTSEVQTLVAEVVGVPFNHVTCICKRMGGGFGGKETQAALPAILAALIAQRTHRPARFVYNKDDDMRYTGKRHPFKTIYRAAFDDAGTLLGVDLQLFADGGCSTDLSLAILERAMLHSDNAYFIPHFRVIGRACRTNYPSNTAFRGFGGPQGAVGIENILEEIATVLKLDALDVRQRNLYGITDRNVTPYGQIVGNNMLPAVFEKLRVDSHYDQRRREIQHFNATSPTHIRGLAMTGVKFGISFTRRTLNQANALVNIYVDGSVLVSTGATEMGQGVNTRIRQIVADDLGVDYDTILVTATNTEKNNNTSPTAASSGTDLNGAAAADASKRLRERLASVAAKMLADKAGGLMAEPASLQFERGVVWDDRVPSHRLTFQQVVCEAYMLRVNLGERGFYTTPGVDFNRETGKGHPFFYYTHAAGCSEVEINRFTGEFHVPRVDLLVDVGQPINPGIDRGQIIGGFIQGMGWVTAEELRYSPAGALLSYSPTTYKIPNVSDVPEIFNINFIENPNNTMSIKRSKAVGEPPLLLGISVWAAVKDALRSAAGGENVKLALP